MSDVSGWLIEKNFVDGSPPEWVARIRTVDFVVTWTRCAGDAWRFARKEDAEKAMAMLSAPMLLGLSVTEHEWQA